MSHNAPPVAIIPYTIRIHDGRPTLYHPAPEENLVALDPQLDSEAGSQAKFCFEIESEGICFDKPVVTWRDAPLSSGLGVAQPQEVDVEIQDNLLTITVTVPNTLKEKVTHFFDINVLYQGESTTLTIWTPGGPRRVDPTIVEKPAEGPPTGHRKGEGRP